MSLNITRKGKIGIYRRTYPWPWKEGSEGGVELGGQILRYLDILKVVLAHRNVCRLLSHQHKFQDKKV